jgi:hypothetical protein
MSSQITDKQGIDKITDKQYIMKIKPVEVRYRDQ